MNATQEDLNRSVRVTAPSPLVAVPASAGTEKPFWEIAAPEHSGPHHATGPQAGNANRSVEEINLSVLPNNRRVRVDARTALGAGNVQRFASGGMNVASTEGGSQSRAPSKS